MKIWYNNLLDSQRHVYEGRQARIKIGRSADNDIILDSPYVADAAAVIRYRDDGWELMSLGLNGCVVDNKEYPGGECCPISDGQLVKIFPFTLTVEIPKLISSTQEAKRRKLDEACSTLIHRVHRELLKRMDLQTNDDPRAANDAYILNLEAQISDIAEGLGLFDPSRLALCHHLAGLSVRGDLLRMVMSKEATNAKPQELESDGGWQRFYSQVPEREREIVDMVQHITSKLALNSLPTLGEKADQIEDSFWLAWESLKKELYKDLVQYTSMRYLKKEIKDIVFGYGPLEDLLTTPTISEIMVVDRDHIYVEKFGVVENSGRRFISDEVTQAIIERIVSKVGRRIDKSKPLVDARLMDGSRVNAVIPPLAVSGPCLTIRKFPTRRLLIDDLVASGSLTRTVTEFLRAAVLNRRNILISGGTGSGKTTLLNCLSDFIPDKERIVTIEDTAELRLKKEHVVRMETKQANVEGAGAYTIRDLVKNALRMRPDRIVVGECRGGEALDMLQAMNTGHDGSLTTIHANSAQDVMGRLEVMVQMAFELPLEAIHRQIASALDLIVQLTRLRNGRRVVAQVTEITGLDDVTGKVATRDIFLLDESEAEPVLGATGRLPTFMGELIEKKLIDLDAFYV